MGHSLQRDSAAFDALRESIDGQWIEEALQATGTATIRRRRLPAEQVIWLVLGMALFRDRRIHELVSWLGLALPGRRAAVAPSAVAQARARVGEEPLRWLFERCAAKWASESADRTRWRGLALYGVDGTTVRVPDSPENRVRFGVGDGARGRGAYPLVRIVTLMVLRSHLLAAARFGPYGVDERRYASELWPLLPDHALVLVDRNFLAAGTLIPIVRTGRNRHWLTRANKRSKWRVLRRLGRGDDLVEMDVHPEARKQDPSLPERWVMRAIRYGRRGFPPQTLLTSLVDSSKYPSAEVVALYHERWELELGYDEVKTDLLERAETIRSKRPAGVAQELWGLALAYNLVRLEMARVAEDLDLPPTRISFVLSLRRIRHEWMMDVHSSPGAIPGHLKQLREDLTAYVLPPRRTERSYPRAVKLKMSSYPRKRVRPLRAKWVLK